MSSSWLTMGRNTASWSSAICCPNCIFSLSSLGRCCSVLIADHSLVWPHPSVIQGRGWVCVTCACFLGADSLMGLLLIQRHAHTTRQDVAILSLGGFSLPAMGGESRRFLGTLLLLGATEARKSITTVIALPARSAFPAFEASPECCLNLAILMLALRLCGSPHYWNYSPLDFLKHTLVYQKDSVFTCFFPPLVIARKLLN